MVSLARAHESSVVSLSVSNLMGKAHGSLAQSGKVKAQTPKVAKQQKKKALTGRAKKRLQFTKRFQSTVKTVGKARGPNSQNK